MDGISEEELKNIISDHNLWLEGQHKGKRAILVGADLSGADLHNVNLSFAHLRKVIFSGANLSNANLTKAVLLCADFSNANANNADLSGASLHEADLSGADFAHASFSRSYMIFAILNRADLREAKLDHTYLNAADLSNADLRKANLMKANLYMADLHHADLTGANLYAADLRKTNLDSILFDSTTTGLNSQCPASGEFVGWKIAQKHLVELLIPEDAKRSSATSNQCRCSKAKVLSILTLKGGKSRLPQVHSDIDKKFVYRPGEMVEVPNFNEDRWEEFTAGIHFFTSKEEALVYSRKN